MTGGDANWRRHPFSFPLPTYSMPTTEFDLDLREHERERVLRLADAYLRELPVTITSFRAERSSGGIHDYFSEGDYWWPDPANPGGPYIRRDGLSNPDTFQHHRQVMRRFSMHVPALVAAWMLTDDTRYAVHAASHLRAWFHDERTRMAPHLRYGQAIFGVTPGRGIGLVDTIHLAEVALAVRKLIEGDGISTEVANATTAWFRDFMTWMIEDQLGIDERDNGNNHSTCWALQVVAFALLCNDEQVLHSCGRRYREILLDQMASDGSFPLELERTRPYNYSLFNLDLMAALCQVLSLSGDDAWSHVRPDGRGMKLAMNWMVPFIADKSAWPASADVALFDKLPVRHPALIFAGLAYGEPGWVNLWTGLESDPDNDESIRNMPIRQPLLWFDR